MTTEDYSGSRLMRRCGQLGIPYKTVIESPYAKERGWVDGGFRKQYDEATEGTIDWGEKKRPLEDKDVTPHSYSEMLSLLGLTT